MSIAFSRNLCGTFLNFTNYKRMNKWIILCLMCVSAQAQAQHNKLLQEYRTKVKAYNQDIKAAGYAASIQQEKEKSAKADFLLRCLVMPTSTIPVIRQNSL